jgi:pyruvate dehydrogenase E2 component (dihydrolipoamide acetyltransferase)
MSMTDADIIQWSVAEGQEIAEGDDLVTIETDKVNEVLEAPASGTVLRILVAAGSVASVGAPIVLIGEPGEDISEFN